MKGYKYKRKKWTRAVTVPEVSLTPLVDTALTLLIIFMVTTPMMHNAIRVDLPNGSVKEEVKSKKDLIVSIDKDGNLFFNGADPIDKKEVVAQIVKAVADDTNQTVFVNADKAISYGQVVELVDNIKSVGGVSYVALTTHPTI